MSHKQKNIAWTILLVVILMGTLTFVVGRPRRVNNEMKPNTPVREPQFVQSESAVTERPGPRNLSLQPEAFNIARRLGRRFSPAKRERSILVGILTIGSGRQTVETIRTQTDKGERVEVKIAGRLETLTWDAGQGALSSGARATGVDRELIERLVLDSPDQFVLGQLRGASYYTVARNVRPMDADDNYAGPLWNIVRVEDPDRDLERRPQSQWRLYYINSRTGLIDKVVSEFQGDKIETLFEAWSDQGGEKWPSRIVWIQNSVRLMELSVQSLTVTSAASQGGQ